MKTSSIKSLSLNILSVLLIVGCSDDQKDKESTDALISDSSGCSGAKTTAIRVSQSIDEDFGDGSDGELYLGFDQQLLLEDKVYNFTNIYTEEGSYVNLAEITTNQDSIITINALGNCELHGDIILPGYTGTLSISCNSLDGSGSIDISEGAVILQEDAASVVTLGDPMTFDGISLYAGTLTLNAGEGSVLIGAPADENDLPDIEYGVVIDGVDIPAGDTFFLVPSEPLELPSISFSELEINSSEISAPTPDLDEGTGSFDSSDCQGNK